MRAGGLRQFFFAASGQLVAPGFRAGLALSLGFLVPGCSAAADGDASVGQERAQASERDRGGAVEPQSSDESAGAAAVFAGIEVPEGDWPVCRASAVPQQLNIGHIGTILNRPKMFRRPSSDACAISLYKSESELPAGRKGELYSCRYSLALRGRQLTAVAIATEQGSAAEIQKCLFRVGLWLTGFEAEATWPDAELFVPLDRSPWRTIGGMPEQVPLVQIMDARPAT